MTLHVAPVPPDGQGGLMRHIRACRSAALPGTRRPLWVAGATVGWVRPEIAAALACHPGVTVGPEASSANKCVSTPTRMPIKTKPSGVSVLPDALPALAAALAAEGHCRLRHEAFDVRADPDGPVLGRIDRGALPILGIGAVGVHVNGLVTRGAGTWLWVARRAADRALDPGKLDHIVAGGVPAGLTPAETLVKEAAEEAAIPAALARQAVAVARIDYAMERPEGLRRDRVLAFDLALPEDFTPRAADGEVAGFALWPLERVLATVRAGDDFKFNVNLVLIDLFLRRGLVAGAEAAGLRAALGG